MAIPNFACALMISTIVELSFGADYMETKPDFIKTCTWGAELELCSAESMQIIFDRFVSGPVDGVDVPIDPVKLKKIKISTGDGPVSMNTTLTKAVITGLSNTAFVRNIVNPDFSADTYIRVPKLRIKGNYNMNGKVLILPVVGRGKLWMEPRNFDMILHTKSRIFEKYGRVFFNVIESKVDFNITGLTMHLDNLFDGSKLLGDSTNTFLNENWKEVSEAFKPIIKKTTENILTEMINRIYSYIPLEYVVSGVPHPSELYGTSSTEKYN